MRPSRLALVLVLITLSACQKEPTGHKSADSLKPRYFFDAITGDDDYATVFDRFTKEDRAHSDFLPVISAFATFWNASMREAYIREMGGRFRMSEEAEKQLASQELQENESYFVFIFSAATREPEWNDFERQKSIWRILLESNDGKIQEVPERVEVVSPKDERAKYFYQHMDAFTRTYRVRFPREKFRSMDSFILRVAGVQGELKFPFSNDTRMGGVGSR